MKYMKIKLTVYVFFIFIIQAIPQTQPKTYFEARYGKLEYGFFIPENYDNTKLFPVVVYLHGFGNNRYVYLDWYQKDIQEKNPCFVFAPRTPPEWADWSGWNDKNLSEPMKTAMHVLDSLTNVYSIDKNRLYVYGISMGGEGVFDLLHKLPGKFAAAMSVCGGGQANWAVNISKTPFWMFHGSADNINPPDLTERVYNELVKIGAKKMRYTNYPGAGHDIWDDAAAEPAWFEWMFAHSLNNKTCPKPEGKILLTVSGKNRNELIWNNPSINSKLNSKIWFYEIYKGNEVFSTVESNKTSIVIDASKFKGPFRVVAVNYCFAKSEPSNAIEFEKQH
jgi:predicted esterase